jgi:hypothetical protein
LSNVILRITDVNLLKTIGDKHIIKGVVYEPDVKDSDGDWMNAEEIEKMAYDFMRRKALDTIDTFHSREIVAAFVCESYIARDSDPDGYAVGSWVVAIKIEDEDVWDQIVAGEICGLSLDGIGTRIVEEG